jgi:hypothetical protein
MPPLTAASMRDLRAFHRRMGGAGIRRAARNGGRRRNAINPNLIVLSGFTTARYYQSDVDAGLRGTDNGDIWIGVVFHVDSLSAATRVLACDFTASGAPRGWQMFLQSTHVPRIGHYTTAGTFVGVSGTTAVQAGKTYTLLMRVRNGIGSAVHVNGVSEGSGGISSYGMPTGERTILGTQYTTAGGAANPATGIRIAGVVGGDVAITAAEITQWHADCVASSLAAIIAGRTSHRWDLETMGLVGTEGEPASITNSVAAGVNLARVGTGMTLGAITPVWT